MRDRTKKSTFKIFNFERIKLERILVISFAICILLLIAAQVLMTNPDIRVLLTQEEKAEGVFFDQSDVLFDRGVLIIDLASNATIGENIWVLVNGQRVTNFSQNQVSLSVKDDDLIEIDGTQTMETASANVTSHSSNVELIADNSGLEVNKNIGVLARVRIK